MMVVLRVCQRLIVCIPAPWCGSRWTMWCMSGLLMSLKPLRMTMTTTTMTAVTVMVRTMAKTTVVSVRVWMTALRRQATATREEMA